MKPDFTVQLLAWNRQSNTRKMPWKGEKDPYKIWLSEIILQQTRVEQGLSYYENFIRHFPTVEALAKAPEEKVFKLWEGLGYYSRCKNLIETARKVAFELGGEFPRTYPELKELKGVGPYTAAAIASFAFGEARAVLDGNVQRVVARYFGISTPIDSASGKKLYQELAQALLDEEHPGEYNQAIMDFGAVICKPQNPLCGTCVQQADCQAFRHGWVNQLPVKEKSLLRKRRWFYYFMIEVKNKVYIRKRSGRDIWENLYELVLLETKGPLEIPMEELPFLKDLFDGRPFIIDGLSQVFKQTLTHQHISGQFVRVKAPGVLSSLKDYQLVEKKELKNFAFPKFINAWLGGQSDALQLF